MDPLTEYRSHYADALNLAIQLSRKNCHTNIYVTLPDSMCLIQLWGLLDGLP